MATTAGAEAKESAVVSSLKMTAANGTEAFSWKALGSTIATTTTKELAKFLFLTPEGWAVIGITAALIGLKKLYDYQTEIAKKAEELTSKIKDENTETKNNADEIDRINDELKQNSERYDELIKKREELDLTIEESKELERLQNVNAELLNQKILLEETNELKKQQAALDAEELSDFC